MLERTLYDEATALLQRAEKAAATHSRIAREQARPGNRLVSQMRAREARDEADTLRRLIEKAFA